MKIFVKLTPAGGLLLAASLLFTTLALYSSLVAGDDQFVNLVEMSVDDPAIKQKILNLFRDLPQDGKTRAKATKVMQALNIKPEKRKANDRFFPGLWFGLTRMVSGLFRPKVTVINNYYGNNPGSAQPGDQPTPVDLPPDAAPAPSAPAKPTTTGAPATASSTGSPSKSPTTKGPSTSMSPSTSAGPSTTRIPDEYLPIPIKKVGKGSTTKPGATMGASQNDEKCQAACACRKFQCKAPKCPVVPPAPVCAPAPVCSEFCTLVAFDNKCPTTKPPMTTTHKPGKSGTTSAKPGQSTTTSARPKLVQKMTTTTSMKPATTKASAKSTTAKATTSKGTTTKSGEYSYEYSSDSSSESSLEYSSSKKLPARSTAKPGPLADGTLSSETSVKSQGSFVGLILFEDSMKSLDVNSTIKKDINDIFDSMSIKDVKNKKIINDIREILAYFKDKTFEKLDEPKGGAGKKRKVSSRMLQSQQSMLSQGVKAILGHLLDVGKKNDCRCPAKQCPITDLKLCEASCPNNRNCMFYECVCTSIRFDAQGWPLNNTLAAVDSVAPSIINGSSITTTTRGPLSVSLTG